MQVGRSWAKYRKRIKTGELIRDRIMLSAMVIIDLTTRIGKITRSMQKEVPKHYERY
jgi:hypothetical protein